MTIRFLVILLLACCCFAASAQTVRPFPAPDSVPFQKWLKLYKDPSDGRIYRAFSTGEKRYFAWENGTNIGLVDDEGKWFELEGNRKMIYRIVDGFALGNTDVNDLSYECKFALKNHKLVCVDSFLNPKDSTRIPRFSWCGQAIGLSSTMYGQTGDTVLSVIAYDHLDKAYKPWEISLSGSFSLNFRRLIQQDTLISEPFRVTVYGQDPVIGGLVYAHNGVAYCSFRDYHAFPFKMALAAVRFDGKLLWERLCPTFAAPQHNQGTEPHFPIFHEAKNIVVFPFAEYGIPERHNYDEDGIFESRFSLSDFPAEVTAYHRESGQIVWKADLFAAVPKEEIRKTEILDIFKTSEERFGVVLGFVERNVAKGYSYGRYTNTSVHIFDFEGQFVQRFPFPEGERDFFKIKSTKDGFEVHTFEEVWTYSID